MSTTTTTTNIATITCEELASIGAGTQEWLTTNPNLLSALDTTSLALATKSFILLLVLDTDTDTDTRRVHRTPQFSFRVKIHPTLSPINAECVSAVEWLVFDHVRVLAVGTSSGYLLIFSIDGHLIHKQIIYPARILKLRVRGTKNDMSHDLSNEEVCVVMDGVVARFEGSDLQNMLQRWFQETQTWDQKQKKGEVDEFDNPFERVPYQVWSVNKYGACADAAITGVMPPPLMELESSHHYYRAVTIGNGAVISAYRLSENKSRSFVGAVLSKVVPATFSTIASLSKLIWRSDQSSPNKPEPKPQSFARASPLTSLKDPPRRGEKLTLSPSGTLAAITDSLGRILLLDTQALVVVRLWKGYRDANCLFMEMLVNKDSASTSHREHEKSDYCLCLAIHAPKKGIIEIWQMRTGPRIRAIQCAKGSKILQPTYRFSSSPASSSSYIPLEVFILNGDSGQLSVINRSL
ncbi:hypothetical protein vseg_011137 [Gypsophila vaccaria]